MTNDGIDADNRYRGAERPLIAAALKASGMSARQAAAKMDISDSRLRQIVNGYQPAGRGQRIAVIAPADTLARIAMVLNIAPEELEAAGRVDAAYELRSRLREQVEWGDDSFSVISAIQQWAEDPANFVAPDDALRFFDDEALLGELQRRIERLREHVRGEHPHGYWDSSARSSVVPIDAHVALSEPSDTTDDLVAADEQDQSISGEQEESETP